MSRYSGANTSPLMRTTTADGKSLLPACADLSRRAGCAGSESASDVSLRSADGDGAKRPHAQKVVPDPAAYLTTQRGIAELVHLGEEILERRRDELAQALPTDPCIPPSLGEVGVSGKALLRGPSSAERCWAT
jgi:hypothetical protein